MDEAEVERDAYDRAAWAAAGAAARRGLTRDRRRARGSAAFGDGGYERLWNSDSVLNLALRNPASPLTRADAVSNACMNAYVPVYMYTVRGFAAPAVAAGFATAMEWVGLWMSDRGEPMMKVSEEDVPMKLRMLLVELLKSSELPELAIGGPGMRSANASLGSCCA